jgi:hypothetical protein
MSNELTIERIKEILNKHYVYSKLAGSRFFDVDTAAEELAKELRSEYRDNDAKP